MQLSQEIFNILKGANIKLKLFDPTGNKTLDPENSARFYAYDKDFLVTIREEADQVELVVQAGASFNFSEHKDVLNSIKKAGHNAMAEYNIRKFDKNIEPKDFAHDVVREESELIDRLKELAGVKTEDKELNEYRSRRNVNWDRSMPEPDPKKYPANKKQYGPIATHSGRVIYYNPAEGNYSDGDTGEVLSYDEWNEAEMPPQGADIEGSAPVPKYGLASMHPQLDKDKEQWSLEMWAGDMESRMAGLTDEANTEHKTKLKNEHPDIYAKAVEMYPDFAIEHGSHPFRRMDPRDHDLKRQRGDDSPAGEFDVSKIPDGEPTEIPRDGNTNNEIGDTNIFNSEATEEEPINEEPVFPEEVELAGDSRWIEDEMWESDYIEVSDITVETDDDGYTQIHVEHNGPWEIYTDTGFEKEISKLVGREVKWSEQGMQAPGVAHLEAYDMKEAVERLKELSGIKEDPEARKMQVTNADKEGNTEAWKRFKAGDPRYEWAGDKKEETVTEAGEKKVSFKDFMSWFFSDSGDDEYAGLGQEAVDTINREGSVTYTPQDMFNRSGYIPGHLVQGASEEEADAEYDPSELTLVESTDSITISKFGDGFIAEGYTPATGSLKTSYIQLPENTKLIIKHSKGVNEEVRGSRSRNIKALFIENSAGERFRFPQKYLQGAKAMANHVSHGGTPYDAIGESIIKLCEEVAQCTQFLRHVRTNKLVNEGNEHIVETIKEQLKEFKNTVKSLQTLRGYNNYQVPTTAIVEENDKESVDLTNKFMYNTFTKTANMDAVLETVARIVKERDGMTELTKQYISRLYDMIKNKEDFKLTLDPNDPEHPDNEDPIKYSGGMGAMAKLSAMLSYLAVSSKNDEAFNLLSHLGSELYNLPNQHVIMLDKITKYLDKNNKISSKEKVEVEEIAESILNDLRRKIA